MEEDLLMILKIASNYQMIAAYATFLVGCLLILRIQRPPKSAVDRLKAHSAKAAKARAEASASEKSPASEDEHFEDDPIEDE